MFFLEHVRMLPKLTRNFGGMSEEKSSAVFNTQIAASCFRLDINYFKDWKEILNAKIDYRLLLEG